MIHLRQLPTVWDKLVLKSYKSPLSRSKSLGVLIKSECTSSITEVIRFFNVKESSREPSTDAEDDTAKELTKKHQRKYITEKISPIFSSIDTGTNMRTKGLHENTGRVSKSKTNMSIEDLRKFIKVADTEKLVIAKTIIFNLCDILRPKNYQIAIRRNPDAESIISPNELKSVFERLERSITGLNELSVLKTFEVCTILKISDSSSLMQKLIKILSSNINSLSSLNVLYLYSLIKMYHSNNNPQIAALKVACDEFFKNCFEDNIHPKSSPVTMSSYVSLEYIPENVKECLIKKIFESNSNLPLWSYTHIVKGLVQLTPYGGFHRECLYYVTKEVTKLLETNHSYTNLFKFLKSYKVGFLKGFISYNESFLDMIALNLTKGNLSLVNAIESCWYLFQMRHFNHTLFEYTTSRIGNALTSGELKLLNSFEFYYVTQILSAAGKKNAKIVNSFFREKLREVCSLYPNKLDSFLKVSLPLNLAILGIYEDRFIENCFTSENGGELTMTDLEELNAITKNWLLLLHQAVVTFHPSYQKPLLSEELVESLAANHFSVSPSHNVWQEVVENCFGGPNFVMKNCRTSLHHYLSYVVILDKNNAPIDVTSIEGINTQANDQLFNISNIPTSEERQVIVFQDIWSEVHLEFKNVSGWKGIFQLYLDVLEMYCNGVIPLLVYEFKSVPSYKRVSLLRSKIEKKFGAIGKPMNVKSEE